MLCGMCKLGSQDHQDNWPPMRPPLKVRSLAEVGIPDRIPHDHWGSTPEMPDLLAKLCPESDLWRFNVSPKITSSESLNITGFMGQMWPPLVFLIPAFPSETPGLQAALRYQHQKLISAPEPIQQSKKSATETATSIRPVLEITPQLPNPTDFPSQSKSLRCLRIVGTRTAQIQKFKFSFTLGTSAPSRESKSSPAWPKNTCGDVSGASLIKLPL